MPALYSFICSAPAIPCILHIIVSTLISQCTSKTCNVLVLGVHEAFRTSFSNSRPLQPSHDSASSLHQTQVTSQAAPVTSRLNPDNLRAIEEHSSRTATPLARTSSKLKHHARRILEATATHLSSSAPSTLQQRAQSNASASSSGTAAPTTASSIFSTTHSPVNNPAAAAVRKLGAGLKATLQELFGATLHLTASTVAMTFPTAFDRLHVSFYRSKITSWMAAQEEDYRQVQYLSIQISDPSQHENVTSVLVTISALHCIGEVGSSFASLMGHCSASGALP